MKIQALKFQSLGRFSEAEKLLKDALAIDEKFWGGRFSYYSRET